MPNHGLGRIPQFDQRSRDYPIMALIPEAKRPRSFTWSCDLYLDQGETSSCVGNSITHEIAAQPVTTDGLDEAFAQQLYADAQKIDGIQEPHDGTSVLAGMKVASKDGYYRQYRWAFGIDDVVLAVGYHGPVVLGIPWYEGMMDITARGYVLPTGRLVGGHAILARAVVINASDKTQSFVRLHNSWGVGWGEQGTAKISLSDLSRLLRQDGDAAVPVKRTLPKPE